MITKIIGAVIVITICGGTGFVMAFRYKRTVKALEQTLSAMERMECELEYRLPPLPELCRSAADGMEGAVGRVLRNIAAELDNQVKPEVKSCVLSALGKEESLPSECYEVFLAFGKNLGQYDLEGQIKGIQSVKAQCSAHLEKLKKNQDVRLRNYQTLGLCAGAALVIIFI